MGKEDANTCKTQRSENLAAPWNFLSKAELKQIIENPDPQIWVPGPRMGQALWSGNVKRVADEILATLKAGGPLLRPFTRPKVSQPLWDATPRVLFWSTKGLHELYSASTAPAAEDTISDAVLKQLQSLSLVDEGDGGSKYGGWKTKPSPEPTREPIFGYLNQP